MTVTVVGPDELGVSEEKLWHEFQHSTAMGTHPFSLIDLRTRRGPGGRELADSGHEE
jgi:hypothetical protein